jgi:hypothetical protein
VKKLLGTIGLIGFVSLVCSLSFAADYIVTNDDNPKGNSATVFRVGRNGELTEVKKLSTGGTGLGSGYFAWTGVSVDSNASCVFVANTGSDTISSFQAPSYKETGSAGIPGMFSSYGEGGSIAVSPNGKLVVSGNSGLLNIATWGVGSNCKLTLLNQYTPEVGEDYFSPVAFTPNGAYVAVPAVDHESVELYSVGSSGALTDLGYIAFSNVDGCSVGCFPTGMDFTSDSKLVVFGNASLGEPSALSASITSSGLSNSQFWNLTNSAGAQGINIPRFTKTARSGKGILLFSASGDYSTSGILCTDFTENPLSITLVTAVVMPSPEGLQGSIVTFGSEGWAAQPPSSLQAFSIGRNCAITLGTTTKDLNSNELLSIVGYPANQ